MPRRLPILATAALAACTSASYYAVFAPAEAGSEADRIACDEFSIVPPRGFEPLDRTDRSRLECRQTPPADGQYRLYRFLAVGPAPAIPDDDPSIMAEQSQALLRQRYEKDDLEVRAKGTAPLAERDCHFLAGRVSGPAAGLFFEVLDFYVPGADHGLVVSFKVPDGQLAASIAAFEQTAATLQTTLAMPKPGALGKIVWLADHHLGLRIPPDWTPQADTQGAIAIHLAQDGAGRCDITSETSPAGCDLDRLLAGYEADHGRQLKSLSVQATEWRQIGQLRALRLVSIYREEGDDFVTDDLFVAKGNTLYRVLLRVPRERFAAQRALLGKVIDSIRIE